MIQPYPKGNQYKNKSHAEVKAIREERVKKVQALLNKGKGPSEISEILNLTLGTVGHLISRHCTRPASYVKRPNINVGNIMDWESVGDPSTLTADQREYMEKLGISAERAAWLLSCPKGGNTTKR